MLFIQAGGPIRQIVHTFSYVLKNFVQSGFGHDVKNCCLYLVGVIPRSPATYRSALREIFNA